MAFSPPAMMIQMRILFSIPVGIAVVGGENSIQRHFSFVFRFGISVVAGANDSTTLIKAIPLQPVGRWMAFSPPAMMIQTRILFRIPLGIAVVGGENSIQRHFSFVFRFGISVVARANDSTTLIKAIPLQPVGRWMAFSPPAMMIQMRILFRIPLGIAVVGGENSIQRHYGFVFRFGINLGPIQSSYSERTKFRL
jgi:hypothetical protein